MDIFAESIARRRRAEADARVRKMRHGGYLTCVIGALLFALVVFGPIFETNRPPGLSWNVGLLVAATGLLLSGGASLQAASFEKRLLKLERSLEELRLQVTEKGK